MLFRSDPGSISYVAGKHRDCAEVGIASIRIDLPATASQADVLAAIADLNSSSECTGYIVQLPLPRFSVRARLKFSVGLCFGPRQCLGGTPCLRRRVYASLRRLLKLGFTGFAFLRRSDGKLRLRRLRFGAGLCPRCARCSAPARQPSLSRPGDHPRAAGAATLGGRRPGRARPDLGSSYGGAGGRRLAPSTIRHARSSNPPVRSLVP